jgi:transcriptional antiterminator NusG
VNLSQLHNRWLVAQVRVGREFVVAVSIRRRGYQHYLPVYEKRLTGRRTVQAPVFPGYLFVRFDNENTYPIVRVPDVIRLVGTQSAPIPVQDSEIEALQIAARSAGRFSPCPFMEVGDPVQLSRGSLTGLKGILVRWKNQHRLVISINLLRQSAMVEVDLDDISAMVPEARGLPPDPIVRPVADRRVATSLSIAQRQQMDYVKLDHQPVSRLPRPA